MKPTVPCALAVCSLFAAPIAAQPPHLEFVRGLRRNGHPDLALEHLQSLAKQRIPPDLLRILPLEMGGARTDLAIREHDTNRRILLFKQAREDLRSFVSNNATSPAAPDAELNIARITVWLGKTSLDQVQQLDRVTARKSILAQARAYLEDADKEFRSTIKSIDRHLNIGTLSADERKQLTETKLRAELEQGISMAYAYMAFDDVLAPARLEMSKQASATLKRIADRDPKHPLAWEARAWLGRFHLEAQDYRAAKKELQAVIDQSDSLAAEAKRVARHARLLLFEHDPDTKDPSRVKLKEAEQWLSDYKDHADTPAGLSVRFHLAEAQLEQSKKRTKSESQRLLAEAEKSFGIVERSASEFAGKAREHKLAALYLRSAERTKGEISQLKDFPECWLRAQVEIYQRNQENQEPSKKLKPEELEKKRVQRLESIVSALQRALELADPMTPAADLNEAQYTLAYIRLTELNDPYGSAILAEDLARRDPSAPRAVAAAGCAVEAYARILAETESKGGAHDADQRRLRALAEFMESTWPADQATDHARFCVAQLVLREENFLEAIRLLGRITPTYSHFGLSQFRLGQAALLAHQRNLSPPDVQPPYQEQAIAALRGIPDLDASMDAATASVYFNGKFELARLLFAAKQFDELARLTDHLAKTFRAFKPTLDSALVTEIEPTINTLPAYAKCGQADLHFRAGRHDEVLNLLVPLVKSLSETKHSELRDPAIIRMILNLALWSHVQKQNGKEAAAILQTLLQEKRGSQLESAGAVVNELLAQLRGQIDGLRGKGPDRAEALRNATENTNKFLDAMAGEPATFESPEMIRFLAFGYSILENHSRAADLLAKIALRIDDNNNRAAAFQLLQIMHARELRLARRFDEARDKLREILKAEWGKNNLDVRRELVNLWEDKGDYAAAARGWNELMAAVRPTIEQNARSKDLYFECYYRVIYCLCKSDDIQKAANWYVKLRKHREDMGGAELGARYAALHETMPAFKKACDELLQTPK